MKTSSGKIQELCRLPGLTPSASTFGIGLIIWALTAVSITTIQAAVCTTETGKYWPGGIVPYVFDANVTPENRQRMKDAMAVWESVSRVAFVPHSSELNWLHIHDQTFDGAEIGRQAIGFQTVNVASWDRRFRMVHLLGHSLGLMDEDMRHRSELFISYQGTEYSAERRRDHFGVAFELIGWPDSAGFGDYDLDSVMHPSPMRLLGLQRLPGASLGVPHGRCISIQLASADFFGIAAPCR